MGMTGTFDLEGVQGQTYARSFLWKIDDVAQSFTGWRLASNIRLKEDRTAKLVLDLAPYLTVADDGLSVQLRILGVT